LFNNNDHKTKEILIKLQSWTKLVETNAISVRVSQFPCKETQTPTRLHKWFPSPLPSLNVSSGEFWWQSNIDKGERGKDVVVSGFQGQSSHSFQSVSTVLSKIVV